MPVVLDQRLLCPVNSGVAAFDPSQVAGLVGWWKADSGVYQDTGLTTLAVNDGDPVGGWKDQSGSGNHLVQSVGAAKFALKLNQQNGLPTCRADGADDYLTCAANPTPSAFSLFVAVKATLTGYAFMQRLAANQTAIKGLIGPNAGTWQFLERTDGNTLTTLDSTSASTAWNLWELTWDGSNVNLWQNGGNNQSGASSGATTTDTLVLGANDTAGAFAQFLNGDVAEVCLYNNAVSTANRQAIENYFHTKWAFF